MGIEPNSSTLFVRNSLNYDAVNVTMTKNDGKSEDMAGKIDEDCSHIVFSSDDQRLELLGQIFGNKTSRNIITILIENEMTAMQISNKLGLKLNLILYHLEKMLSLQIISITKRTKNSRGHQVKHYRAKQAVIIFSKNAKSRAVKSKMLSDVIKRITRFSAIGIAGVFTWIVTNISIQGDRVTNSIDTMLKYPRPTLPPYMTPIEPQSGDVVIPVILGCVVVASLLVIDRIMFSRIILRHKLREGQT